MPMTGVPWRRSPVAIDEIKDSAAPVSVDGSATIVYNVRKRFLKVAKWKDDAEIAIKRGSCLLWVIRLNAKRVNEPGPSSHFPFSNGWRTESRFFCFIMALTVAAILRPWRISRQNHQFHCLLAKWLKLNAKDLAIPSSLFLCTPGAVEQFKKSNGY